MRKKQHLKVEPFLRSLQVAYQASTIFFENNALESDIGTRIGLWVSAFEILVHTGDISGVMNVIELLGKFCYQKEELKDKTYTYKNLSITLPQMIYSQLYASRNAFFHGNPIEDIHRYPFGNRSGNSFLIFAPLLYKIALITQLYEISFN